MSDATGLPVLVMVRDLLFSSRIVATARAVGVDVKVVRDAGQVAKQSGSLLIVDLNQPGAIEAAGEWKSAAGGKVVGFVSHVDVESINRARAAGIDTLPRSRFVEELETILKNPAGSRPNSA